MYDRDNNKPIGLLIETNIKEPQNAYTIGIDCFSQDLEAYLGIAPAKRADRKPQHIMGHLKEGKIDSVKLIELNNTIQTLLKI